MEDGKRPTLRDVALRAGVSTGTVSLVLNGSKLVAERTRRRVMGVIDELSYVYDRGAAQLRSRRTNIVGLSVCNLTNPYFAQVAVGIEKILDELGYVLLMGNCAESVARQKRFLETIREYNVDGLLMIPARDTRKEDVASCFTWGIPLIMVSRYVIGADFDFAGSNNRAGTAAATRHLIDLGHETIAFVGLNRKTTSGRERVAGYRAALREAGLKIEPRLIVECGDTRKDGFHAIKALLASSVPPTGVVCFNDVLAFGVMLGLRDLGLVPGKDCSVLGHDDVAEAALWSPPLSTVRIDVEGIGTAAAELLRARLEGAKDKAQRRILETSLVIRSTCSPPAAGATRSRVAGLEPSTTTPAGR